MASTAFSNNVTTTDATWFNDVDSRTYNVLSSVSGTNTIAATGPVSMTAYAANQVFIFTPANTNTGATTVNITPSSGSALGAKNIFSGGAALIGGELVASAGPYIIEYDGTQFNMISQYAKSGNFTPAVTFGGGNTGITYSQQVGKYSRIGNTVFFSLRIILTSKGSSTGAALITALPFTSVNVSAGQDACGVVASGVNAAITGSVTAYVNINATDITPLKFAAGNVTGMTDADFTNTTDILISGHYRS